MAAKFALVSKIPALKLAFKCLLFALAVLWFRSDGGFVSLAFLFLIWALVYFRPFANASVYLIAGLASLISVFVMPTVPAGEIYVAIGFGLLLFLVVGVKNLVLLERKAAYRAFHFIIFTLTAFLFFKTPGIKAEILAFLSMFLLFREFYLFMLQTEPRWANLKGLVLGFVFTQLFWGLSLFPIHPLQGALLSAIILFAVHDAVIGSETGNPPLSLIIRDIAIVAAVLLFILIVSTRGLA